MADLIDLKINGTTVIDTNKNVTCGNITSNSVVGSLLYIYFNMRGL